MSDIPRTRGNGTGIEIGTTSVRAVRLSADVPGRLVVAVDERVFRPDTQGLIDALVRVATRVGITADDTLTIAVSGRSDELRAVDVTGRAPTVDADVTAHPTTRRDVYLIDAGPRRWQVSASSRHTLAEATVTAAHESGLGHARIEPAPLAIARVLRSAPTIAWRGDHDSAGWFALCADGLPLIAMAAPPPGATGPHLSVRPISGEEHREFLRQLERYPDDAHALFHDLVAGAGRRDGPAEIALLGDPYPPYPIDDVRAAARQCVALGAALSSAGLTGRVRTLRRLTAPTTLPDRRPWLVERLPDEPAPPPTARRRARWLRGGSSG